MIRIPYLMIFFFVFFLLFCGYSAEAELRLTYPQGGDVFQPGEVMTITWEGINNWDRVRLEYSTDNGVTWKSIQDSIAGSSYQWTVPQDFSATCIARAKQLENSDTSTAQVQYLTSHQAIRRAVWSPNGSYIMTEGADQDKKTVVWNASTGKVEQVVKYSIINPTFSLVDSSITGFSVGTGSVYNIRSLTFDGNETMLRDRHLNYFPRLAALSNDNRFYAINNNTWNYHGITIFDATTWDSVYAVATDEWYPVTAFSRDGSILYVVDKNKMGVWQVDGWKKVRDIELGQFYPKQIFTSADGQRLVLSVSKNSPYSTPLILLEWDSSTNSFKTMLSLPNTINSITDFHPDGTLFLATTKNDSTVLVLDAATGSVLHTLTDPSSIKVSASFDPQGKRVLTASQKGTLIVWDAATGQIIKEMWGHKTGIKNVRFSPNHKEIITTDYSNAIIWDVVQGIPKHNIPLLVQGYSVGYAEYSPDDSHFIIALSSLSKSIIQVYDALSYTLLHTLSVDKPILHVHYSPDGRTVMATTWNSCLWWNTTTWEQIGNIENIYTAVFRPDGKLYVTPSQSLTKIFDPNTGVQVGVTKRLAMRMSRREQFSPDGSMYVIPGRSNISGESYLNHALMFLSKDTTYILRTLSPYAQDALLTPEGKYVVAAYDTHISIREAATGTVLRTLPQGATMIDIVDSTLFATIMNNTVFIWKHRTPTLQEAVSDTWGIANPSPLSRAITVLTPNGGEEYEEASSQMILWESTYPDIPVTIEYSVDGGQMWRQVADSIVGNSYSWKNIPPNVSKNCLIRVSQYIDTARTSSTWSFASALGGGMADSHARSVAVDSMGNIVVTGEARHRLEATDGNVITTRAGEANMYVARYDRRGRLLWMHSPVISCSGYGSDVEVTPDGSVVVAGTFCGIANFGNGLVIEPLLGEPHSDDPSVGGLIKYAANGSVEWVRQLSGNSISNLHIAVDKDGSIAISGCFKKKLVIDGQRYTTNAFQGFFIANYSAKGKLDWIHIGGGTAKVEVRTLFLDPLGIVYAGGSYGYGRYSNLYSNVDTFSLGKTLIDVGNLGRQNGFLIGIKKTTGEVRRAERTDVSVVTGISSDNGQYLYVAGYNSAADRVVTKYGLYSGKTVVKQILGGPTIHPSCYVGVDQDRNVFMTGVFVDSLVVDSNVVLRGGAFENIFIAKYDPVGRLLWARQAEGRHRVAVEGTVVLPYGGVVLAGSMDDNVTFDHISLLRDIPYSTPFIAALNMPLTQIFDQSDRWWSVAGGRDSVAKIMYPRGADQLVAGDTVNIQWKGGTATDIWRIEYSTDNGNTWNIITNEGKGNSYPWVVPSFVSMSYRLRITSISTRTVNPQATFHTQHIATYAKWVPGKNDILTASVQGYKGELCLWRPVVDSVLYKIKRSAFSDGSILFSPDARHFVAAEYDFGLPLDIYYYDAISGAILRKNPVFESAYPHDWKHDGSAIYATFINGEVYWDPEVGFWDDNFIKSSVFDALFSPLNDKLAVLTNDSIKVAEKKWPLPLQVGSRSRNFQWSPNGRDILLAMHEGELWDTTEVWLRIWNTETTKSARNLRISGAPPLRSFKWNRDGSRLLIASQGMPSSLWDIDENTLKPIGTLPDGKTNGQSYAACWDPAFQRVATADIDNVVRIWDMSTGTPALSLKNSTDSKVVEVEFNSLGTMLLARCSDSTVRVYSVESQPVKSDMSETAWSVIESAIKPHGAISFGSVGFGDQRDSMVYVVRNITHSMVTIASLSIEGEHTGDFEIIETPKYPIHLLPDEGLLLAIRFRPKEMGRRNAILSIKHNSLGIQVGIPLEGIGIPHNRPIATGILKVADVTAMLHEIVEIPVLLQNANNLVASGVTAVKLTIAIDHGSVLKPEDSTLIESKISIGDTVILVLKPQSVSVVKEEVLRLYCRTMLGKSATAKASIVSYESIGGMLDIIDTISGVCVLEGICQEGGVLVECPNNKADIIVKPNPASDKVDILTRIHEDGSIRLSIHDVIGNTVSTIFEGKVNQRILYSTVDIRSLAPGIYYIRLITPTTQRTEELLILR